MDAARVDFRLYAVTDRQGCAPQPLASVVAALVEAGVSGVQIREKDLLADALVRLAEPIAGACRGRACYVLINTHVEVACRVGAEGVHLPAAAPAVDQVRQRVGQPVLVGCSTHTLDEAVQRAEEGADFLTCSPVYLTPGKPGYGPALGLEGLRRVCAAVPIPVFALAGVTPARVAECLDQGAWGIAVMSSLMPPASAAQRAREYLAEIRRHQEGRG